MSSRRAATRSIRETSIRILPGQYYDAETGTHYNYYRDYDPAIGRYEQSDPIGLSGGLNTYEYARNHPLISADPSGLLPTIPSFSFGIGWKSQPPGKCSWARYDELVEIKNRECGQSFSCDGISDCAELGRRAGQGYACLAARENLMNECFGGGDDGHQQAVAQVKQAIKKCLDKIEAGGCCGPVKPR